MTDSDAQKQIEEAEEILGKRLETSSFVKGIYFGQCLDNQLPPYPLSTSLDIEQRVQALRSFCEQQVDAAAIDRESLIPDHVIRGLGDLGILGACLPASCGGLELSQTQYCRLLEILGGHCGSTALFVNAHHSIGPRAIVLFGDQRQKDHYLPKLASGQWISAFALTEPEAGSDAANVQTTATPTPDGSGYVLNGEKRWITNGGIAQVLTVMARTPMPDSDETKITAFIVEPQMKGFEVLEKRMDKCGVRGTATARLAFRDMFVPRENILGAIGSGLRVALTVLDFGRTTFGASCTGAAKFCVEKATTHAARRVQFGKTLGSFEMVKRMLADMQSDAYAMAACTYQTSALIDAGASEFMLETAILKVFSTDRLWRIVNDTIQVFGGKAYFADEPYERMMRDARINMIGEGANDVLRAFCALVGMRDVGLELQAVLEAVKRPLAKFGTIGGFAGRKMSSLFSTPELQVSRPELEEDAHNLGRSITRLGKRVEWLLARHRESIVDQQHQLGRIADAAIEIYVSACVLRRLDCSLREGVADELQIAAARHYLVGASARIAQSLKDTGNNLDQQTNKLADLMLSQLS